VRRVLGLAAAAATAALLGAGTAAADGGAQLWHDAGCGSCHTLAAAGSAGTVGPNLDLVQPTAADVVIALTRGRGAMPPFVRLGGLRIDSLAVYVASVAGHPAAATTATPTPTPTTVPEPAAVTPVPKKARPALAKAIAPDSSSAAVKRLQLDLRKLGFFKGPVTGFYGLETTAAVKRFQAAVGLQVDGIWGAKSRVALAQRLEQAAAVGRAVARARKAPLPPPAPWVTKLQTDLHRLGLFHHPVTGVYGPVTTAAVAQFQLRMGLTVDGQWGPKSQHALVRRLTRG